MYSSPDENSSKRRKVRKGTRSCWECRRRKVKCTFESPQDVICITCHRRGAKCASQRDFDDTNLSSRPAEGKEPPDSLDNTPTKSPGASRPVIRDASGICTPSISLSESSTPAFSQHAGSVVSLRLIPSEPSYTKFVQPSIPSAMADRESGQNNFAKCPNSNQLQVPTHMKA
jgi:hypothetical protein